MRTRSQKEHMSVEQSSAVRPTFALGLGSARRQRSEIRGNDGKLDFGFDQRRQLGTCADKHRRGYRARNLAHLPLFSAFSVCAYGHGYHYRMVAQIYLVSKRGKASQDLHSLDHRVRDVFRLSCVSRISWMAKVHTPLGRDEVRCKHQPSIRPRDRNG